MAAVAVVAVRDPQAAAYLIEDNIFVIFNGSSEEVTVSLPEGIWNLNVCGNTAGTAALSQVSGQIQVSPIAATVLTRA